MKCWFRRATLLGSIVPIVSCGTSGSNIQSNSPSTTPVIAASQAAPASLSTGPTVGVAVNYHYISDILPNQLSQSTRQRNLQYISSSTTLITVTVTPVGGSPTSYGPTACTTATCNITFTATPGPKTLMFSLIDGSGQSLSQFSTMAIVQPTTLNTLNFTANPVVNSVVLSLASSTVTAGTASSDLLTVNAKDIDGNTIIGNSSYLDANGNPISLLLNTSNNQNGGAGSVSIVGPSRITAPNQSAIYAKYDGRWLNQTTISVSSNSSVLSNFTSATLATVPTVANTYTIPTASSSTSSVTVGPDNNFWFAEYATNKIGRMTPSGVFSEWTVPTSNSQPYQLVAGRDGNIWFEEFANNKVGRITPSGTITEFTTPSSVSYPCYTTSGPDGNIWFTENAASNGRIGFTTLSGVMTEYALPTNTGGPNGITLGPDGNLWFAEYVGGKIGRSTSAGVITEFSTPTAGSGPVEITPGPDGNLWFTEYAVGKIGRITPTGTITEFTIPTASSSPFGITLGPDGNLWFTENAKNKIGSLTTSGTFTEYTLPTATSGPKDIVTGPDNNLWLMEESKNTLVQFVY